jgi:hypothetical protein
MYITIVLPQYADPKNQPLFIDYHRYYLKKYLYTCIVHVSLKIAKF